MQNKRLFYTNRDSGMMFLFTLVIPLVLALIISMIISQIASGQGVKAETLTGTLAYEVITSLLMAIVYVLLFVLFNKANKVSFRANKIKFKMPWHTYLVLIAVGVIALFGLNYFVGATNNFLSWIGYPVMSDIAQLNPTNPWLFILSLVINALIPAICEELLFRGVILQGLRKKFKDWGAILLCGVMFALFHGNLQQFIYPFMLGCIMSWVVIRTGSIVSSMIVHFANNALVVTLAYLQNMKVFSLSLPNTWWFYILAFVLVGITGVLLWLIDKFYFKKKKVKIYRFAGNNKGIVQADRNNFVKILKFREKRYESKEKRIAIYKATPEKVSVWFYISVAAGGFLLLFNTVLQIVSNMMT